jgi:hypothetical protein
MSTPDETSTVWDELDELLEESRDLGLTFGMQYSGAIDWCTDITPTRNHPQARQYGEVWTGWSVSRDDAVRKVVTSARAGIETYRVALATNATEGTRRTS